MFSICSIIESGVKDMMRFTDRPSERALPLFETRVPAGFPSPADDHVDRNLDLNEHLIRHPAATYFVRAEGESMRDAGIFSGDLLVVDRSLQPRANDIVIAIVFGELTVKRLVGTAHGWRLIAANPAYADLSLQGDSCEIWGVVIHSIRTHGIRR